MLTSLNPRPFSEKLIGPRVSLVRAHPRYTEQVWNYLQRDHAQGGENYRWIESAQDVEKYITSEVRDDLKEVTYLILKDDKAIGSFHIHTISYADHKAEVGYALEVREVGHGYASAALQLVEAEMKRLGFNKLVIICNADNTRSIKVAKRNDFRREGLLLQDRIEDAKLRDSVIFGKILQ